ncbi:MAG: zinc ribbon domain-containing protein [Acidimicrobiales bacterium]
MPIYEFRCSECEARFEARRPAELSDATPPTCPSGHTATRRVLSVFATAGKAAGSSAPAGDFGGGGCGPGCACANR